MRRGAGVFRFPRQVATIKKSPEIRRVKQAGRVFEAGCFRISILKRPEGGPRAGFVVSKRVVKQATARNHLKRLMREFYRLRRSLIKDVYDVLFEVRGTPEAVRWDYRRVEGQLDPLLKQTGIMSVS